MMKDIVWVSVEVVQDGGEPRVLQQKKDRESVYGQELTFTDEHRLVSLSDLDGVESPPPELDEAVLY